VGSHIIRRNEIHHCEQGGIIGRMGGVFSVIEDNHIHHINNMMELGGAEVAGIKLHAAIDVIMRRNHIHHCVMGIWTDWEAQGTRITQNLLHDNMRPAFAEQLKGGMGPQDIFVEVGHGPTLIDNNILLSEETLRMPTEGLALVHNLICGSFTSIDEGCDTVVEGKLRQRYTPYHIPHRTEVMGFMTILHGDDRFYNNIFVQRFHRPEGTEDPEYYRVGTHRFDDFPTYDEWIDQFDVGSDTPDMGKLAAGHFGYLPVWCGGNVFLGGAVPSKKHDKDALVNDTDAVSIELTGTDAEPLLETDLYRLIGSYTAGMISTDTLGEAFEPEQRFEDAYGRDIVFDTDYRGDHRGVRVLPGPFAQAGERFTDLV
ncbi:MAG: right-handed parallel beta-helix repeat-containing protein, partial [Oscillospiraceae bacterium]|nr:right-handed parallel beta-helix repeat-containing protein [Oscillospiraceae bacterium]